MRLPLALIVGVMMSITTSARADCAMTETGFAHCWTHDYSGNASKPSHSKEFYLNRAQYNDFVREYLSMKDCAERLKAVPGRNTCSDWMHHWEEMIRQSDGELEAILKSEGR